MSKGRKKQESTGEVAAFFAGVVAGVVGLWWAISAIEPVIMWFVVIPFVLAGLLFRGIVGILAILSGR